MKFYKFPMISRMQAFIAILILAVLIADFTLGSTTADTYVHATLIGTLMQPLRSKYQSQFDKNELRESRYGALRLFQQEAATIPIFDDETRNNIMRSYGNSVVIPVLDAQTVSVATPYTRTCDITDDENTSALVTLTFASYGWAFSMTPATHYNNDVKYQKDFERKFNKYLVQFASQLDLLCIAQLEADKNQLFTGLTDYYAVIADALQVPQVEKDDFYNQAEALMATMDFYAGSNIVSATSHMPVVRRQMAQGAQNDKNDAFQFQGGGSNAEGTQIRPYNWFPTNRLANGVGVESTAYLVNEGSVYIGNRNDADSVLGASIGGDHKVWGEEVVPLVNMRMGTFFQQDCSDQSAIAGAATAGNTRSKTEGYEFSTDIVVASVYNSDIAARYNPILKAEILN